MNILLGGLTFLENWAYNKLKTIIKPNSRPTIIPLAFRCIMKVVKSRLQVLKDI